MGTKKLNLIIPFFKKVVLGRHFSAIIDVTDRCNLRCAHCYHLSKIQEGEELDLKTWERRFKKLYRDGIRNILIVGGEPSLRVDVLELADKFFPYLYTFTNGLIKISSTWQHRIQLSIDGLEMEHDRLRGAGIWQKAIANYRGDKRVIVNCVISKLNYMKPKRLKEFIEYVKKMDVSGLNLDFYVPKRDSDQEKNLSLSQDQYEEVGELMLEELKKPDNILTTSRNIVRSQMTGKFRKGKCAMKDNHVIMNSDTSEKFCVNDSFDCRLCRSKCHYTVAPYHIFKWWQHKNIMWDWSMYAN